MDLAEDIRELSRQLSRRKVPLMDGIILATARSRGQRLLTFNPEFTVFGDAKVVGR